MSPNPYAPPAAAVADIPIAAAREGSTPFFAVSLPKLAVLSVCSFGFYEVYWFYKNWRLIQAHERSAILPVARAIFAVFYCYACFARIRDKGNELGVKPPLAAGWLAAGWILATVVWKLPDPYWLVTLLAFAFLLPVQAHANRINQASAGDHDRNTRFSGWNWLLALAGGGFLALAIVGTLMPQA
jgi:hypothetical protein